MILEYSSGIGGPTCDIRVGESSDHQWVLVEQATIFSRRRLNYKSTYVGSVFYHKFFIMSKDTNKYNMVKQMHPKLINIFIQNNNN